MGRIKTSFIKHIAIEIFEQHPNKFSTDFDKNKDSLKEVATIRSKRIRNITAGYLTSLRKRSAE